ncbi:unnamed protein product [Rotaria sordida]|uniref:Uncharacterized protein n=1 Tax=Rotaria sordida TaxID=392033 RepID=A0A816GYZ5_9BILA|nr:unnamed protein product [Rotaria sordida]CAF1679210.1 unnamed protein product [Rotaria sordida]
MEKKQLNEIICSFETYFISRLCRSINKKRKELTTSALLRSAHIQLAEKDDDEDDEQINENETDDEETMQDNQDENDQTNTSKITIKEDFIDDVPGNLIENK